MCAQRPRRQRRKTRAAQHTYHATGSMCSTPGGVSEGNTRQGNRQLAGRIVCSTPGGVSEGNTGSPAHLPRDRIDVLNARRRQRRKHPAGQPPTRGSHRVLNARRRQRRKHHPHRGGRQRRRQVLNARRRQRRKHAGPAVRGGRVGRVLNARRRQRRKHNCSPPRTSTASGAQRPEASAKETPGVRRGDRLDLLVLNARRRQRRKHGGAGTPVEGVERCSTPGGVSEGNTPRTRAATPPSPGAQRPEASAKETRSDTAELLGQERVLNARRRQRRKHAGRRDETLHEGVVLNARRRQRRKHGRRQRPEREGGVVLNARRRQRRKHGQTLLDHGGGGVCSTPGGVSEGNTSRRPDGGREGSECSTPGGVSEGNTASPAAPCPRKGYGGPFTHPPPHPAAGAPPTDRRPRSPAPAAPAPAHAPAPGPCRRKRKPRRGFRPGRARRPRPPGGA